MHDIISSFDETIAGLRKSDESVPTVTGSWTVGWSFPILKG